MQTIEESSQKIFDYANGIILTVREFQESVNVCLGEPSLLDNTNNIGLQYNNKIVELSYIFADAGIEFYVGSSLTWPILWKLQDHILDLFILIHDFLEECQSLKGAKLHKKVAEFMDTYIGYSDKVNLFKLKSDLITTLTEYLEYHHEFIESDTITKFEHEIISLGFKDQLPEFYQILTEKGLAKIITHKKNL